MTRLGRQALALAIGLAGGVVAWWLSMPLAWMLGPMIACTGAALMQVGLLAPNRLRPFVMPVIGVLLGSRISADVLRSVPGWLPALAVLIPFLIVTATVSFLFYRRIGGYDRPTAFFSAMPGGLTDMILMGAEAGGDERRISLAHATRVLLVICGVVFFYTQFLGVTAQASQSTWVGLGVLSLSDWLILAACAVLGAAAGRALRLPAGQIMGPMVLSGVAHVVGWVTVAPPSLMVIAALWITGTIIGCRFVGARLRDFGRDLVLGAGSSALMIGVAVAFAYLATEVSGTALSETFLAYSPGGLVEMSLLALAMGQDITYVTVMHLIRIFVVIFGAGISYRLLRRRH